ncbi:hypothetical protein pb186bvf_005997 [Paramecium bursaria]
MQYYNFLIIFVNFVLIQFQKNLSQKIHINNEIPLFSEYLISSTA